MALRGLTIGQLTIFECVVNSTDGYSLPPHPAMGCSYPLLPSEPHPAMGYSSPLLSWEPHPTMACSSALLSLELSSCHGLFISTLVVRASSCHGGLISTLVMRESSCQGCSSPLLSWEPHHALGCSSPSKSLSVLNDSPAARLLGQLRKEVQGLALNSQSLNYLLNEIDLKIASMLDINWIFLKNINMI